MAADIFVCFFFSNSFETNISSIFSSQIVSFVICHMYDYKSLKISPRNLSF